MQRDTKRGVRRLSASEAALWGAVRETVTPIDRDAAPLPKPDKPPAPARRQSRPAPPPLPAAPRAPVKLGGGDPKEARKVARGRREIDATLDLHGLTQDQAYARLVRFVDFAASAGSRTLLVVTGKGRGERPVPFAEAPRGILRERFLSWVEAEPLASRIASVRPAHQRHGGRGAFYVLLKRRR